MGVGQQFPCAGGGPLTLAACPASPGDARLSPETYEALCGWVEGWDVFSLAQAVILVAARPPSASSSRPCLPQSKVCVVGNQAPVVLEIPSSAQDAGGVPSPGELPPAPTALWCLSASIRSSQEGWEPGFLCGGWCLTPLGRVNYRVSPGSSTTFPGLSGRLTAPYEQASVFPTLSADQRVGPASWDAEPICWPRSDLSVPVCSPSHGAPARCHGPGPESSRRLLAHGCCPGRLPPHPPCRLLLRKPGVLEGRGWGTAGTGAWPSPHGQWTRPLVDFAALCRAPSPGQGRREHTDSRALWEALATHFMFRLLVLSPALTSFYSAPR